MRSYYENEVQRVRPVTEADRDAITVRVGREVHENGWNEQANRILINDAQIQAYRDLTVHYTRMFTDATYSEAFSAFVQNHISDPDDLQDLTAYFFWGGWASAANRPGETYSYSHNWPYDPDAGNTPTMAIMLWSFLSILALFAGTMTVLYIYGQMKELPGDPFNGTNGGTLTTIELETGKEFVRPTQRSTYKFFAFAVILFLVQVLVGLRNFDLLFGGFPAWGSFFFRGGSPSFCLPKALHSIL